MPSYRIGRNYYPACHRVRVYTAPADCRPEDLKCPTCDGPTRPAHQDDEEERR